MEFDNKVLTYALKYYDMGWCILPAKKGEKHPIIPWKDYQYKRPTREQIIEWFKNGDYNIFLVTGKISGICVVDVDINESGSFTDEAEELIRKLPLTLLSITGRKGHHYFFKYPNDKELGNFTGKIPGIDFRGEGGGVILSPSIHKNGSEYFFDITEDIELCNLEELICDFPYELFKGCFELIGNPITSIETNYQLIAEGKRNNILMSHAGTIFKQFPDRPELARLLVLGLNQKICNPPLPEEEIEKTILASIIKYHPIGVSKDDWSNPLIADELIKLDDNNQESYLVKGLVPKGGTTVMSGDPGSNKTWIDMAISIAVASGNRLFDHFDTEQCPVWIIDKENNKREIKNRFRLLGLEPGLPIYVSSTKDFVFDFKNRDKILDFACEKNIKLIIYDSLRRIHKGEENSSRDISELFELLTSLHVKGISNILTHHHNKNTFAGGGSKMRGSTDILASVDCHITVSKRPNRELILEQTKNRYGEELKPFKLKISTDTTSYFKFQYEGEADLGSTKRDEVRKNITELLKNNIEPVGRKTILESIKEVVSCSDDLIDDVLKEMTNENVLIKEKNWNSGKSGERVFYRLA